MSFSRRIHPIGDLPSLAPESRAVNTLAGMRSAGKALPGGGRSDRDLLFILHLAPGQSG
jgi:hypothetical protein